MSVTMSITTRLTLAACTTALMALPVASIARTQREHGAHVHGTTTIDVAQDGRQLSLFFEMPGVNAVGYEHPPHSAAEQAQLDAALKLLRAPADWLVPNGEALCKLANVDVTPNGFDSTPSPADSKESPSDKSPEHHEHA